MRQRQGFRSLPCFILMLVLLGGLTSSAVAVSQTPAFSGTVSMVVASLALEAGAEWGTGILTLTDGKQYRFTVKGIDVGSVGAAKAFLHGRVYNLVKVEDFAGLYGAVEIGFTVMDGSGGVAMRNEHDVVIYLESIEQGVEITLGASAVEIKRQE